MQNRPVEVVGPKIMTVNGHNTYIPGTNNEWLLNDTYPNKSSQQNPYLFHLPSQRRVPLGHFDAPRLPRRMSLRHPLECLAQRKARLHRLSPRQRSPCVCNRYFRDRENVRWPPALELRLNN